jgi:hypothetical protein
MRQSTPSLGRDSELAYLKSSVSYGQTVSWSNGFQVEASHSRQIKQSSSPPSPSPIAPSVQRRSSFVQLPRACVWHVWERPSPFPEPLPNAFFGQPRSLHELMRTAFEFPFPFRMTCQKLPAQRRFHEVRWSTDLVPSLTTGRLRLNWSLSSPSYGIVTAPGLSNCRVATAAQSFE